MSQLASPVFESKPSYLCPKVIVSAEAVQRWVAVIKKGLEAVVKHYLIPKRWMSTEKRSTSTLAKCK